MKQIKDTNETKTLFDKLESMPLQGNFIRTNKYALELEKQIQSLKDEIEVLRRYGNKDCTAMADEALTQKAEE